MDTTQPRSKIPPHAKKVFSGVIFDVYQWDQEMFDGSIETFERLRRIDSVVILPVLPDGRILFVDEEQPDRARATSAIAGRMEPNETPEAAARREFREETGYEAGTMTLWYTNNPPGKIEWSVHTFIARDLHKVGEPQLDAGEKITPHPLSFEEFLEHGSDGHSPDTELRFRLLEAKHDPEKRAELQRLFGTQR